MDVQDAIVIRQTGGPLVRFGIFRWIALRLVRSFVNRGHERGYLDSRAYHSMHAMIDRVLSGN